MDFEEQVVPEKRTSQFDEELRDYALNIYGTITNSNDKSDLCCYIKQDKRSDSYISISKWEDLRWLCDKLNELLATALSVK